MKTETNNKSCKLIKFLFSFWLLCVLGVVGTIVFVVGVRKELFDKAPEIFVFILLGFILLGCVSFGLGSFLYIVHKLKLKQSQKPSRKKHNIFTLLLRAGLFFALFPLYFLWNIIEPIKIAKLIRKSGLRGLLKGFSFKSFLARFAFFLAVIGVVLPIWFGGYVVVGMMVKERLNYITEPIALSGTGSMYPTFPRGKGKTIEEQTKEIVGTPGMTRYPTGFKLFDKRLFSYEIGRGDIVSFFNDKTKKITERENGQAVGFVKRVLALPGDTIEIHDGIFYLNGKPQEEQYILKARSTFGGQYLTECKVLTIPDGKVFVMGDNRKGSGDSRHELGLVDYKDINHVIPWKKQIGNLDLNWRDTSKDLEESSKIRLDVEKYLGLLNEKREEAGVRQLRYQPKLEESAKLRGQVVLEFDDLSFEATRSGYTMEKAMRGAEYSNIIWGEVPTLGYYEAEELLENQLAFPDSKKFLLNWKYQEIGIAEVEGEVNRCPAQVIVIHVAGYIPPNYKTEDVKSWKTNLSKLREIQPSWANLKDNPNFYQKNKADIDRINEIIVIRVANISTIVAKMEANQWLTAAEQKMIEQDKLLYDEQETIATRLNSR